MNNNIIYRQDAINSIKELPRWIMDPNGEFQPVDPPTVSMIDPEDAVSAIENLPSAQSVLTCDGGRHVGTYDTISRRTENDAAKRLNDLIFDINPAEICSQIESDNLKTWCETVQIEMKMAMVQLPCWAERREE